MPTFTAYAKANLFLRVLARETSGYHQIETLFCLLDLHDDLTIETGTPGLSLNCAGAELGEPRDNLVWRAAESFFVRAGIRENAHLTLVKRIPAGAGLGGGSSDAAATLRGLNEMHGSPLGRDVLLELGAALGADVPFFISGSSLALAWGRGERLGRLTSPGPVPAVVIVPDQRIPTATAYQALDTLRARSDTSTGPVVLDLAALGSWSAIEKLAHNDFEEPAILAVPVIRDILEACRARCARIAMVSGSGSACFATFEDATARDSVGAEIAGRFPGVVVAPTLCGVDPHRAPV